MAISFDLLIFGFTFRCVMNRCRLSNITIAFHITIVFALTCILVTLLHDLKNNVDLKRNPSMLEKRNNILDFGRQWCRLEKWRHDWEGLLGECSREMAWEKRNTTSTDRTSAGKSYISSWELSPIGKLSVHHKSPLEMSPLPSL